jgi:hypothetical protein
MPEVISGSGHPVGFSLRYGPMDFINFKTLAIPSDIPIQPGATYVFKIPDQDQRAWDAHKVREHRPDPKRIEIVFAQLSFGDGTGFDGTDAKEYPFKREQSAGPCREGPLPLRTNGRMSESQIGFIASD